MKRNVLLLGLALFSMVSCEAPEVMDGWKVVNPYTRYIIRNSLDVPVEVTSYKGDEQQNIGLAPDEEYQYWSMFELPSNYYFEEGKIYFFQCDSVMLYSSYHDHVIISVSDLHELSDKRKIENGFEIELVINDNL